MGWGGVAPDLRGWGGGPSYQGGVAPYLWGGQPYLGVVALPRGSLYLWVACLPRGCNPISMGVSPTYGGVALPRVEVGIALPMGVALPVWG